MLEVLTYGAQTSTHIAHIAAQRIIRATFLFIQIELKGYGKLINYCYKFSSR